MLSLQRISHCRNEPFAPLGDDAGGFDQAHEWEPTSSRQAAVDLAQPPLGVNIAGSVDPAALQIPVEVLASPIIILGNGHYLFVFLLGVPESSQSAEVAPVGCLHIPPKTIGQLARHGRPQFPVQFLGVLDPGLIVAGRCLYDYRWLEPFRPHPYHRLSFQIVYQCQIALTLGPHIDMAPVPVLKAVPIQLEKGYVTAATIKHNPVSFIAFIISLWAAPGGIM